MTTASRLDPARGLAIATQAVPPIPPELQAWAEDAEDLSLAGRLLE